MQLSHVNTGDLVDAIRLGCRMMCRVFNADDNDIPFFSSEVKPNPRLGFSAMHGESHVPGRHLNALLTAEHAAGIRVDPQAIRNHANAAFFSYSGPLALPLNRTALGGPLRNFVTHNLREGFHALYALVRYRASERARQLAEHNIGELFELFTPATGWDFARLERQGLQVHEHTFIMGIARAIGPLVKYYRATGYAPALQLATMLRDKAVAEFFLDSGAYDHASFGSHTHSTTCVMSSLAQLADLLDDRPLLERVKAFYDHGLWEIRDALGWVIESSAADANPDRGEINNSGDVVETALILGRRGYPEYFEDAECITRCHILPSQLRDNRFITDPPNPEQRDGLRQVADRHLGGAGLRVDQLQHRHRRRRGGVTLRGAARSGAQRRRRSLGKPALRPRHRAPHSGFTLHPRLSAHHPQVWRRAARADAELGRSARRRRPPDRSPAQLPRRLSGDRRTAARRPPRDSLSPRRARPRAGASDPRHPRATARRCGAGHGESRRRSDLFRSPVNGPPNAVVPAWYYAGLARATSAHDRR